MIVVFDAHCLLCSGSVQLLLRHDTHRRLRFATIQSDIGRNLLERAGVDAIQPDSFVLVLASGLDHLADSVPVA